MNSEMPTLCNKFNFKSVIMKAILLENGIYIGVDTNVDKSLDDSKIQESKELVCCNVYSSGEAILFGGRVGVRYRSSCDWNLSVDGIKIKVLGYNTDYPYFANSFQNVVANLNQMQQLGVDTFLANYKLSLEKTKDELTVICDKLEGELKSIDLKVVLLFGGSLALASALEKTGAGILIADKIVGIMGSNPSPIVLLLVIFVVTCVLTNFMSNTATTALMVPIAVSLAESLNADPRAVVIATVIAGSCAYATPIGMPANTMVVGVGGYKFKDYVKSGLPLILVSFVLCMILLPILYPFYP